MSENEDKKGCEECGWKGWLHMSDPFEIQRCDTCSLQGTDEDAARDHATDCGCDWPPFDFQAAFFSWVHPEPGLPMPLVLGEKLLYIQSLAGKRDRFVENLPKLGKLVGKLIHMALTSSDPQRTQWMDDVLDAMRGAAGALLQVNYLVSADLWKSHWLLGDEDGTYDNTGRWIAPQGGLRGQS